MILPSFMLILLILWENISKTVNQSVTNPNNTMEQFLDRLLQESIYDRRIRPFIKDGLPVVIKMNMNINTISGINEVNMVTTLI